VLNRTIDDAYQRLRDCELEIALQETRADLAAGHVHAEAVDDHLRRHPDLRQSYRKTLLLLEADPHHPSLRLHALRGRLQGSHEVVYGP
jgi:Fe-S cluster assembly scaffold protein SufB